MRTLFLKFWLIFNARKIFGLYTEMGLIPDRISEEIAPYSDSELFRMSYSSCEILHMVIVKGFIFTGVWNPDISNFIEIEYYIPLEYIFKYKEYAMFKALSS